MRNLDELKYIIDTNLETLDISTETKRRVIQGSAPVNKKLRFRRLKIFSVPAVALIITCVILFSNLFSSKGELVANAQDLMKNITPSKVENIALSNDFIKSQADFSVELFKQSVTHGDNALVSPISVYLALGMTANGAGGNTLKEFESVLGKYNLKIADINRYCYSYTANLNDVRSGKLNIANSIWYAQDSNLNLNKTFLQTNADYYGASAYKADFNSQQAVRDINNWVKSNTGNLIEKIIDKIDPNTVMYIINTLYFEADWQNQYNKGQVRKGDFKLADGKTISTEFMYSTEQSYIKDDRAQGFIKPYKDNKFSFMALLPDEGVSVDDYTASLTGEKLLTIIKNRVQENVIVGLPKFKSEYSKSLVVPLKKMGLKSCFDLNSADFNEMDSNNKNNLFVSDVKHKTFIQVDGLGTKAGAVTAVEVRLKGMPEKTEKKVILDRPFVYAIIDNKTKLPIFIGTMNNPQ